MKRAFAQFFVVLLGFDLVGFEVLLKALLLQPLAVGFGG